MVMLLEQTQEQLRPHMWHTREAKVRAAKGLGAGDAGVGALLRQMRHVEYREL